MLTNGDLPQYTNDEILVDELFTEIVSRADGIERSWVSTGERGRANISFSIRIECSLGYGGEDCETVYTCRKNITCDQTLSYCNSEGECICRDECALCIEDTTCTGTTSTPTTPVNGGDLESIIAGVLVSVVLVLVIIVIIIVVVAMLCYKKKLKERQKAGELAILKTCCIIIH